jgi:arylsulfatase
MCTPFQWTKQIASHFGGTRNGMVISWPKGIAAKGELRTQFHHCIDVVPTILEACHVTMPSSVNGVTQKPIEGVSLAYTFAEANAKDQRTKQYFELLANRAIYSDGWVACTTPVGAPWDSAGAKVDEITGYNWELYDTNKDFSQAHDLAAEMPDKLKDLQLLFYSEAASYNVLPIDNSKTERLDPAIRPSLTRGRKSFSYTEGMVRIPEGASPDIKNKSWSIKADVEVKENASGIIVTQGGLFGGWGLYLNQGKPVFHYNFVDVAHFDVAGKDSLTPGKHTIEMQFAYDGGGIGRGGVATVSVDGSPVAKGRVERTIPIRITLDETLDIGEDCGTPVNLTYDVPFRFEGDIEGVTIELP